MTGFEIFQAVALGVAFIAGTWIAYVVGRSHGERIGFDDAAWIKGHLRWLVEDLNDLQDMVDDLYQVMVTKPSKAAIKVRAVKP